MGPWVPEHPSSALRGGAMSLSVPSPWPRASVHLASARHLNRPWEPAGARLWPRSHPRPPMQLCRW